MHKPKRLYTVKYQTRKGKFGTEVIQATAGSAWYRARNRHRRLCWVKAGVVRDMA